MIRAVPSSGSGCISRFFVGLIGLLLWLVVRQVHGFVSPVGSTGSIRSRIPTIRRYCMRSSSRQSVSLFARAAGSMSMSMNMNMGASSGTTKSTPTTPTMIPSWSELKTQSESTPVGQALVEEVKLRQMGHGSAHVQNKLRLFSSTQQQKEQKQEPSSLPAITLFRDHAGWCPYCQKTMLLIEEKEIPIQIELVPMRSYGDKPREFLQKVPNGLLPAIQVKHPNGKNNDDQIITESQVIMELLDEWHSADDGYKPMLPTKDDTAGWSKYNRLARLERELFSWWCTLVFRPDPVSSSTSTSSGNGGFGLFNNPFKQQGSSNTNNNNNNSGNTEMSSSMKGFLDCLKKVDSELLSTGGPWFFDEYDYPTMIDFIYVSHVERMLASAAHWKGLNIRDPKWNLKGITAWLEAFEKREPYVAFKSDYFTHVMDIPPQYGPGYDGGFANDRQAFSSSIFGTDGSWHLPLSFDDPLQPLYHGPPLPLCVLKSMKIEPDDEQQGTYHSANPKSMERACRYMAAWKLSGNGENVAKFAARGGPQGSKNPRKAFGAPLADPYANPDESVQPYVDAALRAVCTALLTFEEDDDDDDDDTEATTTTTTTTMANLKDAIVAAVPLEHVDGVKSSLAYLRDRVGVPRDLPLASARYLRAYLNWGIDSL